MNLKDIKKLMKNNPSVFQIVKTDSVYIPSIFQYELIELDSTNGLYKVISRINFNQFMKMNVLLSHKQNKGGLYTQSFYKLIKE